MTIQSIVQKRNTPDRVNPPFWTWFNIITRQCSGQCCGQYSGTMHWIMLWTIHRCNALDNAVDNPEIHTMITQGRQTWDNHNTQSPSTQIIPSLKTCTHCPCSAHCSLNNPGIHINNDNPQWIEQSYIAQCIQSCLQQRHWFENNLYNPPNAG